MSEFKELEEQSAGRVRVVHVLSCEEVSLPGCEQGFITAEIIRKYADVDHSSFFLLRPAGHVPVRREGAGARLACRRGGSGGRCTAR